MDQVILVNELDQMMGLEEKLKAHQLGLLHRAFSIFLFRNTSNQIEILMQQRHPQKYHCGGLWTNTCCSHPREHENTLEAAHRRLLEELGIVTDLKQVGQFIYRAELNNGLIEHELDHVFIGEFDGETANFHPEEISEVKWLNLDALRQDMLEHPARYTPWLRQALEIAIEAIQQQTAN
ncbi:MAG: mvaD idi [Gammaproteobacteria bacterium]|jgi:diphosphomevalonate decarboxylase|nr:mvaD idi [Gammaproteobacteria bacterium]